jgi:Na+/proline symporter
MISIQIYSVTVVLNLLGINGNLGAFICLAVLIAYSSLGGMRAIALTDLFQLLIIFVVLPNICGLNLEKIQGFSGLYESIRNKNQAIFSLSSQAE